MEVNRPFNGKLTSVEMGKLWATYMGNSMSKCTLGYFSQHVEDQDIKKVVEKALRLSESLVEDITKIFNKENFPLPIGFTDEDVNLNAPRLFADEFYLHYLNYAGKAGMSIYSIAITLVAREDIREFFINTLNSTIKLLKDVKILLQAKGIYIKPPQIPIPEKVDFIKKQNYLNGFFGDVRPLHALEIAHLFENITNNLTSKALLVGFSQVAQNEKVRDYFLRGRELTNKHIEICSNKLHKDHLPSSLLLDPLVTESTIPPFSDKMMLAHKTDMFSMKIRTAGNGLSLDGRRDIGGMYAKFIKDLGFYVEDGAAIMIDHGWMGQPPEAAARNNLASP